MFKLNITYKYYSIFIFFSDMATKSKKYQWGYPSNYLYKFIIVHFLNGYVLGRYPVACGMKAAKNQEKWVSSGLAPKVRQVWWK
jgi:hypothetical protein